jgi:hypothetical protein
MQPWGELFAPVRVHADGMPGDRQAGELGKCQ